MYNFVSATLKLYHKKGSREYQHCILLNKQQ